MKRIIAILIALSLLLTVTPALNEEPLEVAMEAVTDETPEMAEMILWDCPNCGTSGNTGNFCTECGASRPVETVDEDTVKPGDIITFGLYEQDNDKSNGPESIDWIVLEVKGDKALVISRYGLVKAQYATTSNKQTWTDSQLRSVLNGEFYDNAFTDEEKEAILETQVDESFSQHDPNHPSASGRMGKNTTDFIYVLSYAEMLQYFPTEKERMCYATEYIRKNANYSDKKYDDGYTCWYWMRNPAYKNNAGIVTFDGSFDTCYLHHAYGVARPCCRVSLSALGLADPPEPGASEETEPETERVLSVWDTVTFGRYNQDNQPGTEPIEWTIIDIDEETGHALLLSKYILDQQPYNITAGAYEWKDCTLRAWLNGTFLDIAFTPEEQDVILVTDVPNGMDQGHEYYKRGGFDTQDKLYLLSYAEFNQTITDDFAQCAATDFAIANGVQVSKNLPTIEGRYAGIWWLRSPGGQYDGFAYRVNGYGLLWDVRVEEQNCGVRPCCWVDLSALQNLWIADAGKGESNSIQAGDTVTFGHYEQDNDFDNGAEPIEWFVLEVNRKTDCVWLISSEVLDAHAYHSTNSRVDWCDSAIRTWLNDDFLNSAFTPEEQESILLTDVDNSGMQANPQHMFTSDNTEDKVFLLSYTEVKRFLATVFSLQCTPTEYAIAKGVFVYRHDEGTFIDGKPACKWWLRSPGDSRNKAMCVSCNGILAWYGETVSQNDYGVRPCCRISLEALEQMQNEAVPEE